MEDFSNKFAVSVIADTILILNPARGPMTPDDALLLAAWLVATAEHMSTFTFEHALAEVLT
jgi:hypothetical protein